MFLRDTRNFFLPEHVATFYSSRIGYKLDEEFFERNDTPFTFILD